MELSRLALLSAAQACMPGIEKGGALIQGADTLVFTGDAVHAYNDHIAVSVPFDAEGLVGAVKAAEFVKLLSKINEESLDIEVLDGSWEISAGKVKVTLQLLTASTTSHIAALKLEEIEWEPLPSNFIAGIKLCRMPANMTPLRGVFCSDANMMSSDGVRINGFKLDATITRDFWIEDSAAAELTKFESIPKFATSIGWAHFQGEDGTVFSTRRRDSAQFPHARLQELLLKFTQEDTDVSNRLPKALEEVVERAMIFGTDVRGSIAIELKLYKDTLEMTSSTGAGKYSESVEWETPFGEEPNISVWVDSMFLREAASKVTNFFLRKTEGQAPSLVFSNDEYKQVASTMVIEAPKAKTKPKAAAKAKPKADAE